MAEEKSLEKAFEELEAAVAALESGDLSLEESFKVYADGVKLVKYCNETIDTVEKKIIELKTEDGEDHGL